MRDAPSLAAAAGSVAALLVPVVIMLFVALRVRRRVSYPHDLLARSAERSSAAALFRSLRLYYDAAIDAACAALVGLAIAGFPGPAPDLGPAVVIDASLSMLAGSEGDRALDEAARALYSDETYAQAAIFALGWDPGRRVHRLRDVTEAFGKAGGPLAFADALESTEAFMSVDYRLVSGLGRHSSVTLVTDAAVEGGRGVTVRRLEARPDRYLYPASSTWDDDKARGVVRFAAAGGAALDALWSLGDDGLLYRAKPEDYAIASSAAGFELSLARAGLWAVGYGGRVLPFESPREPGRLRASGAFSSRVVEALEGPAPEGSEPRANSAGRGARTEDGAIVMDGGGRNKAGYFSITLQDSDHYVMPPAISLGSVVAVGLALGGGHGADLALGPAAIASPESALPFWAARASSARRLSASSAEESALGPARRQEPVRVGDGFLYAEPERGRAALVVPPLDEYARGGGRLSVGLGRPPDRILATALALAALYCLKLALAWRFGSKAERSL